MSTDHIDPELRQALDQFCALDRVLVASDYDGCIAPIQPTPDQAFPNPDSLAALSRCAERPGTLAALVSGRARDNLAAMSGAGDPLVLVGSHGAEFDTGFDQPLTAEQAALLEQIIAEFRSIAAQFPGTDVEVKPASTTLHVRNAAPEDAEAALELAHAGPAGRPGVHITAGKAVIELAVIETSKGLALDRLRESFGAQAVLYLGDDVTDEKAFAHLRRTDDGGTDVGIKVGDGHTAAQFRVPGTDDVTTVLAYVAAQRR
ncbi:trehalose-phosphatase [Gordonia hirsuta DSM 44140 = NBRC 16056]|uniref:Trehalose 6-phosphate phosphatase n=1 Tax=Gordonia hirsuta DSM 44140 = NBRC 16056 TaxID=1121927 RepID=L7LA41_9ACTN|nr:trehalose-phosphatase [Gordonia hirsuta]GAC56922.1 trehalose-phosphatase [Gordonia hirsuta DSM 44140 = NBRC 16056]